MRLLVTIQVVKNGYLVSYPKINRPTLPNQYSQFIPVADNAPFIPNNIPSSIEDHQIITDEQEIVHILQSLRQAI